MEREKRVRLEITKWEGRTVSASEHGERIGRVDDRADKLTEDSNQPKRGL